MKITLEKIKKLGRGEIISYTEKEALEAVRKDGLALQYVHNQTSEICLAAVKKDGYALKYVKDQTPEICLAAVKKDGYALQYVKDQTPEICLAAVKQEMDSLQHVNKTIFCQNNMKKTKITKVKVDVKFEPFKENNEWIDNINPEHYKGEIETFDYLADKLTKEELEGFCKGNIIKYVTREKKKGGVEDLNKSSWYLNKLIIIKSF